MKKIIILMTCMSTYSCFVHAQKPEIVSYTYSLGEEMKKSEQESLKQFFLSSSGLMLSIPKKVTTYKTKKGVTEKKVTDETLYLEFRPLEKGIYVERDSVSNILYIAFDTKNKQRFTLPFAASGDGKDNQYVLMCDTKKSSGGITVYLKTITLDDGETYKIHTAGVGLMTFGLKEVEDDKTTKIKSRGARVKK